MSSSILRALFVATITVLAFACAPPTNEPDSDELVGADERTASREDGVTGSVPVGTTLVSTTNVNLRSGASTSYKVLHVVPTGGKVVVQESSPQNGFYKVKHNGTLGWTYGAYYNIEASGEPPSQGGVRDDAIARAKSGMGFSYWWGHGRFRPEGPTASNKGSCSGSCPNCSHSGSYGGDCSGFVAKVWQVPSSNTDLTVDSHPYSTADFINSTSQWSIISRSNVQKADSLVYRSGGAGHIFVYSHGDGWNSMYAYECKGCSAGCVEGYRTASSAYKAIKRAGW